MNWLFLFLPVTLALEHPTASPVRAAICSAARTMRLAIGTMARAAEKNTQRAGRRRRDIPATPFVWTAKAHDILQKVIRANRRLSSKKNEALH